MDVLAQLAAVVAVFVVATVATVAYQRSLGKPGGRPPGSYGDAFNPVNEIFHPAAHRATQDLKRHEDKVEIVPSPDGDDDESFGPVRLLRGPDGEVRDARMPRRP